MTSLRATAKQSFVLISCLLVSGCVKLQLIPYMDQALTLQDLGIEKDQQHKYVINTDAKFDQMRKSIEDGSIKKYKSESDIIKAFGFPIRSREITNNGTIHTEALYRYTMQSKGANRVYVYYDEHRHISNINSL